MQSCARQPKNYKLKLKRYTSRRSFTGAPANKAGSRNMGAACAFDDRKSITFENKGVRGSSGYAASGVPLRALSPS